MSYDEKMGKVIGIDLGTAYSCVGVYQNSEVKVIANDFGNRITPSYVAFTDSERLLGDAAMDQASTNPKNTIYHAKRLIGRKYNESETRAMKKCLPFEIVNKDNRPYVEVEIKDAKRQFTPEEISAFVLQKMKSIAESYLGHEVTHAVITVPASFDDSQRQATKDASTIAGLVVIGFINEPTAAAIAYGLGKQNSGKNIIVLDIGASKLEVTILCLDEGLYEVLGTSGDTALGGFDFNENVVDYFTNIFKQKYNIDITNNISALVRLRSEVEKVKKLLSSDREVRIHIENLVEGIDFSETLTREKFEDINDTLFKAVDRVIITALDDTGLKRREIEEIIMVGGSSRIPKIQWIVKNLFNGRELNVDLNPDEAVAYGATVFGAMLSQEEKVDDIIPLDVNPLSIGVEVTGGRMAVIIPRTTTIPHKRSHSFSTSQDNQSTVSIKVFQGERPMTKDNNYLGTLELGNIPPAIRGVPNILVTFHINAYGILNVQAENKTPNSEEEITISLDKNRPTDEEIKEMVESAKHWGKIDVLL